MNAATALVKRTLVLGQLALLHDRRGHGARAIPLYTEALKIDPEQVTSAVNLGSLLIQHGQTEEAMRLWRSALERSPGTESARMNLAVAQYRTGDFPGAEASLRKLLELNPGARLARMLLSGMESQPQKDHYLAAESLQFKEKEK